MKTNLVKGDKSKVKYNKPSAIAFLKDKTVTQKMYYVVVDTPEGSFGRDINGLYQE